MPNRITRRRVALCLGVVAVAATACAERAERNPVAGDGRGCAGGHVSAADVLDCLGPSVALIDTPVSAGSAVLLDGGYLVTNAHVVDPFAEVTVTFPLADPIDGVPVVGIDAFADIAVLGPVPVDRDTARLAPGDALDRGDDLYLVGFPGEVEDDPEVTISRGVLSRTREAGDFDLTYLQTDASIGGGQSGGALVDERGRVVGISGLAFAEEFALALDGADVQASIERILAGEGDPYATIPDGSADRTDHHLDLADDFDTATVLLQAQEADRALGLALTATEGVGVADVGVEVVAIDGELLLINAVAAGTLEAVDDLDVEDELGLEVVEPTADGVYEVEVPAGVEVMVAITSRAPGPAGVDLRTSIPGTALPHEERRAVRSGDVVRGSVDQLEIGDTFTIQLAEGDTLELLATSPSSDMAVYVRAPGAALEDVHFFDDGGGGLYDYDAVGELEAEVAGTYVIVLTNLDVVVTGYELEVQVS